MNEESKNLCVPVINIDSEGKKLVCCYKSLDLNLGHICPALCNKPYIINIISFVNEDLKLKLKNYVLKNLNNGEGKNEDEIKKEIGNEEEEKQKEKEGETPNEEKSIIDVIDEKEHKYLSVKGLVKKGENIQIFVEVPQILEEENTVQITSTLNIESSSEKSLELNIKIILTTIPISVLISCEKYKLIKEEKNQEEAEDKIFYENIKFRKYFKLDTPKLIGDEEINFEILNYKNNEPIEFYISAKSLENNSSEIPIFSKNKQKNNFQITIPKYEFQSSDNEIPRLHCLLEIFINPNFVIYIKIDSLIKPNLTIFKMYDYYSKKYVQNELKIYLNENVQKIFKKKKRNIELHCQIISTLENEKFSVIPEAFYGGRIKPYGREINKDDNKFILYLEFNEKENEIIPNESDCKINISINNVKLQFKIIFSKPQFDIYSDNFDFYSHFKIKGKNSLQENWNIISKPEELKRCYVTPFNYSEIEIDYKNTPPEFQIEFYYINDKGFIISSPKYEKKIEKGYILKDIYYPFCLRYEDLWFPLIKNGGNINGYNSIYFESWSQIKEQVHYNFKEWENKIKAIQNSYYEISHLREYNKYNKSDFFYQQCEKIIKNNIIKGTKEFKKEIEDIAKSGSLNFEGLAYHILFNTVNILNTLQEILPENIKLTLKSDYNYYEESNTKDDKLLALYNYILRFQDIFDEKENEFRKQNKKIKIIPPDILKEQTKLLFEYYSIDPNQVEIGSLPKIIIDYERKIKSFLNDIDKIEIISSEKFLIIGNQIKPVNKREKPNFGN